MRDRSVTLQVFAHEEGPSMFPTLAQLARQRVPGSATVTREVWVTLSPPDRQLCDTWQTAMAAQGWQVYEAPDGKLSSRNKGHEHAVEQGADVIACVDADAPPISDSSLAELVRPFRDPSVAGVNGKPVASTTPVGLLTNALGWAHDVIQPHFNGQCHAFTSQAWKQAGPFRVGQIDETVSTQVRREEEFQFRRRVESVGRVVDRASARFHNDTRRSECSIRQLRSKFGGPTDPYCAKLGTSTFQPRERYNGGRRRGEQ